MEPEKRTIHSRPFRILQSDSVEICLTQLGGMTAPVTFYRNSNKPVQPYYTSPRQDEDCLFEDPVPVALRGDSFYMPFGANNSYRDEDHAAHGEPATESWTPVAFEATNGLLRFEAQMQTTERPGTIAKRSFLKDPRMLPATVFWLKDFGRHAAPWNGRNCCIGLEDVCVSIAEGLIPSSRKNVVSEAGLPTQA